MQADKLTIENVISEKIKAGKKKFGVEFEIMLLEILGLQKLLKKQTTNLISKYRRINDDSKIRFFD